MMIRVRDNTGMQWLINATHCTFRNTECAGQLYIYTPRETIRALTTMEAIEEALIDGGAFRDLTK